ncbi:type I-B CRISPR-associated protein Cas5 [Candidatus Bathyarchaeota archaeon]|nr:type I-B CRISPR-associated protein Cas5 [Candidatus Bathyarchaeota archaeon]
MKQVLAFDLWGPYGHFKKIYTTTSPLTYSIPPRTAITGLISAIIGLDKTEYLQYFSKKDADIAVQILNPVKKVTLSQNLIDTKTAGKMMNKIEQRTQIRFELLKDPKYRIYFRHRDPDLLKKLTQYVMEHRSVYTPCLGLSEHIANFSMNGLYELVESKTGDMIRVNTVVPEKKIIDMEFEEEFEYVQENLPNEMNPNRVVTEYASIILEQNTKAIKASVENAVTLDNGDHIVFL